jgi:hypothetical protein
MKRGIFCVRNFYFYFIFYLMNDRNIVRELTVDRRAWTLAIHMAEP